jgi:hypothetical protein
VVTGESKARMSKDHAEPRTNQYEIRQPKGVDSFDDTDVARPLVSNNQLQRVLLSSGRELETQLSRQTGRSRS